MRDLRLLGGCLLGAIIAFSSIGPAHAARAVVSESTTVRSGPGSDYRSLGRLRAGDRVTVNRCASSRRWCHVSSRRTSNGWVRSRSLDRISGSRPGGREGICFFGRRGEVCINR